MGVGRMGRCWIKWFAAAGALIITISLAGISILDFDPASGMESRPKRTSIAATPLPSEPATDPLDGDRDEGGSRATDPLDGDPLDGEAQRDDADAPSDETRFEIVRSGRPNGAPKSVTAYDDDPETVWNPEADSGDSWLWLDLGETHRLRVVRWLAKGSGMVELSVSSDRRRWASVDSAEVSRSWQGIGLRDDARYVRLELVPDDDGALPEIAEVAVYGREGDEEVALEQKADRDKGRKKDRNRGGNDNSSRDSNSNAEQDAESEESTRGGGNGKKSKRSGGSAEITAEEGETRCSGDRERCRARAGKVSVEEDCEDSGSCTIDIQADGGTATCDATGGDENKAGDGEGRRNGDGGRCEAVANGGAVSIGDVNP
jgi:hypothetical protein